MVLTSMEPSTGVHTVADVFCMGCNERVGWFYHRAADPSQKYKEGTFSMHTKLLRRSEEKPLGKYLLERERLVKENAWTLDDNVR